MIGGVFRDVKLKQHCQCQCAPSTTVIAPRFNIAMPPSTGDSTPELRSDRYGVAEGETNQTGTKGLDIGISQVVEFKRDTGTRVTFAPAALAWKAPRISAFRDDVFLSPK